MEMTEEFLKENWHEAKQHFGIQQKPTEWIPFIKHLTDAKDILEIGSCTGGSTVSLSRIAKKLVSVEMIYRFDTNKIRPNCEYIPIIGNSSEASTIEIVHKLFPDGIDAAFIDGDHAEISVTLDFNNYKDLVRPGGIMAFHDIVESDTHKKGGCTVYKFWQKIKNDYKHEEILSEPYEWGGIGILWMP